MNKLAICIYILIIFSMFISCEGLMGKKEPVGEKDPYENFPFIFPVGREPDVTPEPIATDPPVDEPTPTKPPKTIKARILEYNQQTKVVYINVGSSTKGIKEGLVGKIYNDKALTQENGDVKLTKVYPSYAEGLASNQNYEIDPKAAIAVFRIED